MTNFLGMVHFLETNDIRIIDNKFLQHLPSSDLPIKCRRAASKFVFKWLSVFKIFFIFNVHLTKLSFSLPKLWARTFHWKTLKVSPNKKVDWISEKFLKMYDRIVIDNNQGEYMKGDNWPIKGLSLTTNKKSFFLLNEGGQLWSWWSVSHISSKFSFVSCFWNWRSSSWSEGLSRYEHTSNLNYQQMKTDKIVSDKLYLTKDIWSFEFDREYLIKSIFAVTYYNQRRIY